MQTKESAMSADEQQGANPVATGLELGLAIDFMEELLARWPERDQRPGQLLRALIDLHRAQPLATSFLPLELAEAMDRISGRTRIADKLNPADVAKQIRGYWRKLEELWSTKKEGMQQRAAANGFDWVLNLKKQESNGGVGYPSRYGLALQPLLAIMETEVHSEAHLDVEGVSYFTEDLKEGGRFYSLITDLLETEGKGRLVYFLLVAPNLLYLGIGIVLLVVLMVFPALGANSLANGTMLIIVIVTWVTLLPVLGLPSSRVALAPWWIQTGQNDLVIEWRTPPRYKEKSFKVLRYVATCPLCKGHVGIRSGGFLFWGRLIGCCRESPREHIFSFDHVTRRGRSLR